MTQDDFEKFEDLLSGVGEIYGKTLSEFALTLWWGALKDYDLTAIRNALSRYVVNPDNGQFMPKPADVVRMIGGTSTDSAMIAWTKVDKAVRQVGTWQDVVFDDPLIHRGHGRVDRVRQKDRGRMAVCRQGVRDTLSRLCVTWHHAGIQRGVDRYRQRQQQPSWF